MGVVAHERRGHPEGREPGQALPDQGGGAASDGRPRQGAGRRLVRPATRARRWASSANRAAASRPSAGCSCGWRNRPPGKLTFDGVDVYSQKGADDAQAPARHPDRVPGSLHLAQPAEDGRRHHRRAVRDPHRRAPQGWSAPAGAGAARPGRAESRAHQPLSAPVLRRPAAADRHRPWTGPQPEGDRLRRAGLGVGRLGPGSGGQPAGEICSRSSGWRTSSSPTTCRWSGTSPTGWV